MQAGTSLQEENWKGREVPYIKHYCEVLQVSFHTVWGVEQFWQWKLYFVKLCSTAVCEFNGEDVTDVETKQLCSEHKYFELTG